MRQVRQRTQSLLEKIEVKNDWITVKIDCKMNTDSFYLKFK
jgi:hypothetical protein